jgi:hypothetical protein
LLRHFFSDFSRFDRKLSPRFKTWNKERGNELKTRSQQRRQRERKKERGRKTTRKKRKREERERELLFG